MNPEPDKKMIIKELNAMIRTWQPDYCRYLFLEAQRMNQAAINKTIRDIKGDIIFDSQAAHVSDSSGRKSLCGISGVALLSAAYFEKRSGLKCGSCEKSLKKIKGGEILEAGHINNWLRDSLRDLIVVIYQTAGREINQWVSLTKLLPKTQYKFRPALLKAVKSLERRGIFETMKIKNKFHVRLILNCITRSKSGKLIVSLV
jgi:hypothetical protein